jgi:large subunit ribosomal protein L2
MAIRKFNPVTPGQRFKIVNQNDELTGHRPEKSLLKASRRSGGRNNQGKMTMRYIGGGHRKKIRLVDFRRDKAGIPGTVKTIEHDPHRTANIALVVYADGEKRYMLAPAGLRAGQQVLAGDNPAPEIGNAMPLKNIPLGTLIHNIELRPGQGGKLARSAGSYAQLAAREGRFATLKMPSGEMRLILAACMATIGTVSNADHDKEQHGKAGRRRWLGHRPRTRGVAMNPVDHPMGGGEGRASGGHPRSRKGLYAKGLKTRKRKNPSDKYIVERRKNKKKS